MSWTPAWRPVQMLPRHTRACARIGWLESTVADRAAPLPERCSAALQTASGECTRSGACIPAAGAGPAAFNAPSGRRRPQPWRRSSSRLRAGTHAAQARRPGRLRACADGQRAVTSDREGEVPAPERQREHPGLSRLTDLPGWLSRITALDCSAGRRTLLRCRSWTLRWYAMQICARRKDANTPRRERVPDRWRAYLNLSFALTSSHST